MSNFFRKRIGKGIPPQTPAVPALDRSPSTPAWLFPKLKKPSEKNTSAIKPQTRYLHQKPEIVSHSIPGRGRKLNRDNLSLRCLFPKHPLLLSSQHDCVKDGTLYTNDGAALVLSQERLDMNHRPAVDSPETRLRKETNLRHRRVVTRAGLFGHHPPS